MNSGFGPIMQLGYVVRDVEEAAFGWAARIGVGPFYLIDIVNECTFRGAQRKDPIRLGFGYWGGVQVELIQPVNQADSLYGDVPQDASGKLHHYACLVKDIDAVVAQRALQQRVMLKGDTGTGLKFVYLEEYAPGGLHLELIQAPESTLQAFGAMEMLGRRWDGEKPVRPMASIATDIAALREAST